MMIGTVGWVLGGCATVQELPSTGETTSFPERKGVYHKVAAGETLWRIAQAYGKKVDDLARANRIPDTAYLEEGQLIFIPGVTHVRRAPTESIAADEEEEGFLWPLSEPRKVTSLRRYGRPGLRILGRPGEDVRAVDQGRVVFSDYLLGSQYWVVLAHARNMFSLYALPEEAWVQIGDRVQRGQSIIRFSTAARDPYIYFELREKEEARNPLFYLPRL